MPINIGDFLQSFISLICLIYSNAQRIEYLPISIPHLFACWGSSLFLFSIQIFISGPKKFYDKNIFQLALAFFAYSYLNELNLKRQRNSGFNLFEIFSLVFVLLFEKIIRKIKTSKGYFFGILLIGLGFNLAIVNFKNNLNIDITLVINSICEHLIFSSFIILIEFKVKNQMFWIPSFLFTFNFCLWILCSIFMLIEYLKGNIVNLGFLTEKNFDFCVHNTFMVSIYFLCMAFYEPVSFIICKMFVILISNLYLDIFVLESFRSIQTISLFIFVIGIFIYYSKHIRDIFAELFPEDRINNENTEVMVDI